MGLPHRQCGDSLKNVCDLLYRNQTFYPQNGMGCHSPFLPSQVLLLAWKSLSLQWPELGLSEVRSFLQASPMYVGAQAPESFLVAFPGYQEGDGAVVEKPGLELARLWNAWAADKSSTCYATVLALQVSLIWLVHVFWVYSPPP